MASALTSTTTSSVPLNLINETLHDYALSYVFEYLFTSKDFQVKQVCQRWNAVVEQLLNSKTLGLQKAIGQKIDSGKILLSPSTMAQAVGTQYGINAFKAFNRCVLSAFGLPLTKEKAVLALPEIKALENNYADSLGILFETISRELDFGTDSIPATAEEISLWMRDPKNAQQLSAIESLTITDRNMTVLPPEIACLSNLKMLNLSNTSIQSLCPQFTSLSSLEILDVSFAPLKELPENFDLLIKLRILNILGTQLKSVPESVHQLRSNGKLKTVISKFEEVSSERGALSRIRVDNLNFADSTRANRHSVMAQQSKKSTSMGPIVQHD
ncbi:MAG: hypothetical protein JSS60_03985 [Verrucomicrobia bacterium]|nr:hypothetical protein [Verrucomicrobiota bacterium]